MDGREWLLIWVETIKFWFLWNKVGCFCPTLPLQSPKESWPLHDWKTFFLSKIDFVFLGRNFRSVHKKSATFGENSLCSWGIHGEIQKDVRSFVIRERNAWMRRMLTVPPLSGPKKMTFRGESLWPFPSNPSKIPVVKSRFSTPYTSSNGVNEHLTTKHALTFFVWPQRMRGGARGDLVATRSRETILFMKSKSARGVRRADTITFWFVLVLVWLNV